MSWQALDRDVRQCTRCPRLIEHCQRVARAKRRAYLDWDYWGQPVPNLGTPPANLLVVGLAPGAHGANRTGRMFTGDRSGQWLFRALYRGGFANQAESESIDDGLQLNDAVITNICRCAPPGNKPVAMEINNCQPFLDRTISLCRPNVLLALGQMAWNEVIKWTVRNQWLYDKKRPKFAHAAQCELVGQRYLLGSYHPSQQNTFTGRLTESMFDAVFAQAKDLVWQTRKPRRHK